MPRFSIIIPVFNKEKFIAKTLKSVLAQTFADFEIIVINDGSTDKSEAEILAVTDERILYFSKENEGVAVARNFGISKASAEYICFLDADDYWYPNFLETMNDYIQKLPNEKIFACAIEVETNKKTFTAKYSINKKSEFQIVNFFDASAKESVLCSSSATFHSDVFSTVGNFNVDLQSGEDTDLWIRIGLKYPVVFIWEIMARYNFDPGSLSRNEYFLNTKINFHQFSSLEKTNTSLKLFLDLNRFSLAIKSKLINDVSSFDNYYNAIDLQKLPIKKRILLHLPKVILKKMISLKLAMANIGLGNSVFR